MAEHLVFVPLTSWWRDKARDRCRHFVAGIRYATGCFRQQDAWLIYATVCRTAKWYTLASVDIESIMDDMCNGYAYEQFKRHPRIREMVEIAAEDAAMSWNMPDGVYDGIREWIEEALSSAVENYSTDEEKAHMAIQNEFGQEDAA